MRFDLTVFFVSTLGLFSCMTCCLVPSFIARTGVSNDSTAVEPKAQYDDSQIDGFQVHFNRSFVDLNNPRGQETKAELERQIRLARIAIPKEALAKLEGLHIWVEPDESYLGVPRGAAALYLPWASARSSYYPRVSGRVGIVAFLICFPSDVNPVGMRKSKPFWLVHELAHAYHDQVIGFDDLRVLATYQPAVDAKLYDSLDYKHVIAPGEYGISKQSPHARKDHLEYFAELTVSYLAWNPQYPHTRCDLEKHDPRGHALMKTIWKDDPGERERTVRDLTSEMPWDPFAFTTNPPRRSYP